MFAPLRPSGSHHRNLAALLWQSWKWPSCLAADLGCGSRTVPEDLPFLEVNHCLGNLRGVVSDALQVTSGVDQAKPGVDSLGISRDLLLEQLEHRPVVAVDPLLGDDHSLGSIDIGLSERIEARV